MPDPVHNDPVAHPDPLLDDEKIFRPVPNDDRAPVSDMIFVDDEDVLPVAVPERPAARIRTFRANAQSAVAPAPRA